MAGTHPLTRNPTLMKTILLSLALLCTVNATAMPSNLYCKITSVNQTDANGGLKKISNGVRGAYAEADGAQFIIDRSSGRMLGPYVGNEPSMWETKVIDYGDDENSFKISVSNRYGAKKAMYMDVRLWADGARKPFVLVDERVFLGWCSYLPIQK